MKKLERRNLPWIYLFLLPTILIFALFYCWPIIQVVGTSFTRWNGFSRPAFIGIDNYTRLFNMSSFMVALRNIALWSLIAMTFHVWFGVLVALVFFKQPPGWKIARAAFMVPMVISSAAWAMIYRFIFNNEFGILNNIIRIFNPDFNVNWFFQSPASFWAITFTWLFYAVIISLVVLADLMAIPSEIHEAARIDGAGGWQTLRMIDMPLCRFSIGTSIIMSITSRISMFEAIALTSRGGPGNTTMSLSIILVRGISDRNFGVANATAVVMFVMGIAVLLIINRLFRMNESVY
ncbi:MAG: sugar ABC transporter permease [Defluviitaleaceae bacterium]|nr:sugar ABC transporter permease [Defluviitaleaceae bacterium]MCL2837234.1 sugar ABC transporter permease [Defluviitaleaceae bacterium]